jgi:DNA-directed RNA polymerase specialized sigma24 family protein
MFGDETEFPRLMERLRGGDPEAARELFERYGQAIQLVVRHRLSRHLRPQFDSVDFTQDAWASFFHIPAENYTFRTPEELVAFLSRLVQHKLIDAYRQRFRGRRGPEDARRLEINFNEPPARQPTPSQFVIAEEEWQRLLEGKPLKVRRALEMLRAGYTKQQIVQTLNIGPKRIARLVRILTDRLRSR